MREGVVSLGLVRRARDPWRKGGPPTVEYLADGVDDRCCVPDCWSFAAFKVSKREAFLRCCPRGAHIEAAVARFLPHHASAERRTRAMWILEGPPGATPYQRRKWKKAYADAKFAARVARKRAAC